MFKIMQKNQCDHGHETIQEVRLLPYGLPGITEGNIIICKLHYVREMKYRTEMGWEEKPSWESLKIYEND